MLQGLLAALLLLAPSPQDPIQIYPGGWRLYQYTANCALARRYERNVLLVMLLEPDGKQVHVAFTDPALPLTYSDEDFRVGIYMESQTSAMDRLGQADAHMYLDDDGDYSIAFTSDPVILSQVRTFRAMRIYIDDRQVERFDLDQISPAIDGLEACAARLGKRASSDG